MITLRQLYNHMYNCDPASLDMPVMMENEGEIQSFSVKWHSPHDDTICDERTKNECIEDFDEEYEDMSALRYAEQFKKVLVLDY